MQLDNALVPTFAAYHTLSFSPTPPRSFTTQSCQTDDLTAKSVPSEQLDSECRAQSKMYTLDESLYSDTVHAAAKSITSEGIHTDIFDISTERRSEKNFSENNYVSNDTSTPTGTLQRPIYKSETIKLVILF